MKLRRIIFVSILVFLYDTSCSQSIDLRGMKDCSQAPSRDKRNVMSKRTAKISIAFFQDFTDSVILYLNESLLFSKKIVHDSTLTSTKFSGEIFSFEKKKHLNDVVTIVYVKEKKFLKFRVKQYPLYTIHSYKNGICFIAARANASLILK